MPKIISAFNGESPIGDTIAKLGASMFGGNTTDNALKNEQLYALQRENTERDNYAKMIADGGIMPTANNPIAQAMIIAAGLDPRNSSYLGRMDAATRYGADDPRTGNWQIASGDPYSSTAAAVKANLAEEARAHDLTSANQRYDTDQDVATKRWLNENLSAADRQTGVNQRYNVDQTQLTERTKPLGVYNPLTKQYDFMPTNEVSASNMQPITSEAEQKGKLLSENFDTLAKNDIYQRQVMGANPTDTGGSVWNYITPQGTFLTTNGVTDVNGVRLPPNGYRGTVEGSADETGVTKTVAGNLQGNTVNNKKFGYLLDTAEALTANPQLFGPEGYVRSTLQEIGQGLKGISTIIDPNPQKAAAEVQTARQEAQQLGINIPELYDPQLQEVETIWGLLVYQGAMALADQTGKGVSDKDVQTMRQILGSPQSMFSSAESMKAKLQLARKVVASYDDIAREALDGNAPVTSPFANQPVTEGVTKSGNRFRVIGQ